MGTTVLQIPVDNDLSDQAAKAANKLGFSSLQGAVRVFLVQLAARKIKMSFESDELVEN